MKVEGSRSGVAYVLVDLGAHKAQPLGWIYDQNLTPLAKQVIDYAASDGLAISAYLTLPPDTDARALPLIVLPHGGPAARDDLEFDWWSQALATRGYAVLQANFRGSAMVDPSFQERGYGEFGRKMQTDLSDGVKYLADKGVIDPSRVCIVGASYGGYAALAGVSLQQGIYRCGVSVAGIADLALFLDQKKDANGERTVRFWQRYLGIKSVQDPLVAALSPARHADAVRVPLLLLHGDEDTVVPIAQSEAMEKAMHDAGHEVGLVRLKEEDHWLSRQASRLQMLHAVVEFVERHNPPAPRRTASGSPSPAPSAP